MYTFYSIDFPLLSTLGSQIQFVQIMLKTEGAYFVFEIE